MSALFLEENENPFLQTTIPQVVFLEKIKIPTLGVSNMYSVMKIFNIREPIIMETV